MIRLLRDGWEILAACAVALVCAIFCSVFDCEKD
jgi:hypothetical protein